MKTTFYETFEKVRDEKNIDNYSLNQMLDIWKDFIEICETGFPYSYIDYLDDLSIREDIENIISDDRMKVFEEYQSLFNRVLVLDEKCKIIFRLDNNSSKDWFKYLSEINSYNKVYYSE